MTRGQIWQKFPKLLRFVVLFPSLPSTGWMLYYLCFAIVRGKKSPPFAVWLATGTSGQQIAAICDYDFGALSAQGATSLSTFLLWGSRRKRRRAEYGFGFWRNGENDEFAFYPLKTTALLHRPPKTLGMLSDENGGWHSGKGRQNRVWLLFPDKLAPKSRAHGRKVFPPNFTLFQRF